MASPVSANPPALAPLRFAEIQRDALRRAETGTKSSTKFTICYQERQRRWPQKWLMCSRFLSGAAQESNLPSDGLRRLTGFEDRLGHRARAAPGPYSSGGDREGVCVRATARAT